MKSLFKVNMPAEVDEALLETLHSGYIAQGPKVEEFERLVGEYLGTDNVVALNSGTSALTLALKLAGVGPGDEVISTAMTCTATNLPVLTAGAKLIFADVDGLGNIDAYKIEELITEKTKAILFVDWGGMPADLGYIMSIARAHNLKVIEDAAHAFGAVYGGQKVGTIADFTCFSLQAIKHITTGDGGLLTCLEDDDYERAKNLRWFGIDRSSTGIESRIDQDIKEAGYKFHMNDLNATIGIVQMKYVNEILARHRQNAQYYQRSLHPLYTRFHDSPMRRSAWWLFTVLLPVGVDKDAFKRQAKQLNIEVSEVHRRNDDYSVFKEFKAESSPGLDDFASRMICIPVHSGLDEDDLKFITGFMNGFAAYLKEES